MQRHCMGDSGINNPLIKKSHLLINRRVLNASTSYFTDIFIVKYLTPQNY